MVSDQALQDAPLSTSTIHDILIPFYAGMYDVSVNTMDKVVSCESAYGEYQIGDHGHSRGLVQISDIYHPEVTPQEAFNPMYALNFLATYLSEGKGKQWTCYREQEGG